MDSMTKGLESTTKLLVDVVVVVAVVFAAVVAVADIAVDVVILRIPKVSQA